MTEAAVEHALGLWAETAGGRAALANVSENHTYRIDAPRGRFMLRLHRQGYQSATSIESELAWLRAVGASLPVPQPVPGRDARLLQSIGGRHAVLFEFVPGHEPAEDGELCPLFQTLGRYAATLHLHVRSWQRPPWFERPAWTVSAMLDPDGLWGDWRVAPGVGAVRADLDRLDARLRAVLGPASRDPDQYGLIHADMRLANLLVDAGRVTLIDFDDSGFCWFAYDLAASLSLLEMRDDLRTLIDAWLAGYASVAPLHPDQVALIEPLILSRRMVLLAWSGTHAETPLARRLASGFAADTVEVGRRLGVL